MTQTLKVLGQANPAATTNTNLYTAPSATQAVISTINICNIGVSGTFRLAIRPAGAAIEAKHYLAYDTPIVANDSIALTLGLSLAATDIITIQASHANMSFSAFGAEYA